MQTGSKKTPGMDNRSYSIRAFVKRVIITLTALVAVSLVAVVLLIYLPLKAELQQSLMDNFNRLSYISYASLRHSIGCGIEGARSLSSRTMLQSAILEYENGEMDMGELIAYTQPKYQHGVTVLESLIKAERFVDGTIIATYFSGDYKDLSCIPEDGLVESREISFSFCLSDGHAYLAMLSPILSEGRAIGYDKLVFDLSDQLQRLSPDTIQLGLIDNDEFEDLSSTASVLQSDASSSLFYKDSLYCRAFHMENGTYLISTQSDASLLEPVYRLSIQTLLTGIGVLLAFTLAVYIFVVRYAKGELVNLENSRRLLKKAVKEANTDPLTKAGSRRFGEKFLISAFGNFRRGQPSPAVFLFDIDNLKHINDTYGHSVGDRVIGSIAAAVQANIRSGDVLLRWGGDEFIGIFWGLSNENALPFAKKLLNTVSDQTIEIGAETINPTISVGISYFNEDDQDFIDAINRADRAMYQSKAGGRDEAHEL